MDLKLYAAFILATVLLALIPGPTVALLTATSVQHGTRHGLLTLAGTATALVLQVLLVAVGLTTLLTGAGRGLAVVRLIGAGYLGYLGVQSWRAPAFAAQPEASRSTALSAMARGLLVALVNPKTLLFLGAFFPQFISPARSLGPQLAVLSASFVAIMAGLDCVWVTVAGWARSWILRQGRLAGKVSGGLLVGAAIVLALSAAR